jgi:glycosyltransferase involved in cell wall biosynthesis
MTGATARAPVRIARIITRLNVGGPAIQAIEMSARLESAGCHTLLVHGRLGPGEGDMSYRIPSPRSFEIASVAELQREPSPFADAIAVAKVLRLLRTFRPAIVHTHMAKAGTVGRTAALIYNATVGRRARARLVHTYHGHVLDGYFSPRKAAMFTAIERALGRRTDAVIAVSPSVLHDLRDRHRVAGADRFRMVPLGFDLSRFAAIETVDRVAARRALALDADAHVAAFVGRLTAIKQPDLFVDAAQRIAHVDDRARFLVAGGGELESSVRAAVSARGLADRVRFLGWQRPPASGRIGDPGRRRICATRTPMARIEGCGRPAGVARRRPATRGDGRARTQIGPGAIRRRSSGSRSQPPVSRGPSPLVACLFEI